MYGKSIALMSKLTNVAEKYPIEAESSILYMWNIFKEWIIIDFAKYPGPYPYPKFQYAVFKKKKKKKKSCV